MNNPVHYLEAAGFRYKPAESPDLWSHLESRFGAGRRLGAKFSHISAAHMATLIAEGEAALLEAMVKRHRRDRRLGKVTETLHMPYVVGTEGAVPLASADKASVLKLVERPGKPNERMIHVLPVEADAMPCTQDVTITGGLYSDGQTVGVYDLVPGRPCKDEDCAYLVTPAEIRRLVHDMDAHAEDIAVVTRKECAAMLAKAKKILG